MIIKNNNLFVLDENLIQINDVKNKIINNIDNNYLVDYEDIENISEDYNIDIKDAYNAIINENNLNNDNNVYVSLYDYRLIENPNIINYFDNIVFKEDKITNMFVDSIINEAIKENDENILDIMLLDESLTSPLSKEDRDEYLKLFRQHIKDNKDKEGYTKYSGRKHALKMLRKKYRDKYYDELDSLETKLGDISKAKKEILKTDIGKKYNSIRMAKRTNNSIHNNAAIHKMFTPVLKDDEPINNKDNPKDNSPTKIVRKLVKLKGTGKIKQNDIKPKEVVKDIVQKGKDVAINVTNTNSPKPTNNNSSNLMKYGKYGLAAAGIAGAGFLGYKVLKQSQNKPRTWIAKKIAALRNSYSKIIIQAKRNPQKAGMLKRIAAKILSVIDKLMAKLQHASN